MASTPDDPDTTPIQSPEEAASEKGLEKVDVPNCVEDITPPPEVQPPPAPTPRELFLTDLAKLFKCQPDAYSCAAAYYNLHKNYGAAAALLFGLSWRTHKEWLQRCIDYWKKEDDGAAIDVAWLEAFQTHYITDIERYPEDA